ncbi:helix-turn-helix domain-containing protein [Flavobacterium sp.]|uniref:helix-turn-helix domain-containing protein n=1 Tax=Flavobacterium sp. TaxID=239 RepID=UPI0039E3866E
MKKQNSLRNLLGVTQQEIAMLLNVSRGQWSMYECGRRDLPTHAVQLLAEIVAHLQSSGTAPAKDNKQQALAESRRVQLEHLLRENQFERLLLEKKRCALEKQQQSDAVRKQLAEFIRQRSVADKYSNARPLVSPKVLGKNFEQDCDAQLLRYEIRLELLSLEKLLLESKLQKINAPNVNTAFRPIDAKE